MRKLFYIISICILVAFELNARDISLSLNYFYIGAKEKYAHSIPKGLDNHGIGIQGNFHLKNKFYLLADAGYYFDSHYIEKSSSTNYVSYADSYLSCYSANVNFAYRIGSLKFCVLPYMGIGLFDEYSQQRFKGDGSNSYPPFVFIDKYHSPTITGNVGFAVEYPVTDKIFVTGGIKYMIDLYDSKYSAFPCLNIGLGYRLK